MHNIKLDRGEDHILKYCSGSLVSYIALFFHLVARGVLKIRRIFHVIWKKRKPRVELIKAPLKFCCMRRSLFRLLWVFPSLA